MKKRQNLIIWVIHFLLSELTLSFFFQHTYISVKENQCYGSFQYIYLSLSLILFIIFEDCHLNRFFLITLYSYPWLAFPST